MFNLQRSSYFHTLPIAAQNEFRPHNKRPCYCRSNTSLSSECSYTSNPPAAQPNTFTPHKPDQIVAKSGAQKSRSSTNEKQQLKPLVKSNKKYRLAIQSWGVPMPQNEEQLLHKVYKTRFEAVHVGLFDADPCWQSYNLSGSHGGSPQLLESVLSAWVAQHQPSAKVTCTFAAVDAHTKGTKLELDLHYFKDFYHLTALLGRATAKQLATGINPGLRANFCERFIKTQLVITIEDPSLGFEETLVVYIRPIDWNRLNPDHKVIDETAAWFDLDLEENITPELPQKDSAKGTPVQEMLPTTFKVNLFYVSDRFCCIFNELHSALRLPKKQNKILNGLPKGLGTCAAMLFGMFVSGYAPPSAELEEALGLLHIKPEKVDAYHTFEYNRKLQTFARLNYLYGIRGLSLGSAELTKHHLATVLGGRIGPEAHAAKTEIAFSDVVVGVDIKRCYGTIMSQLIYPIGHPTLLYYTTDQSTWPSLFAWFNEWRDQLVDYAWYLVIDTAGEKLRFRQDLFLSKTLESDLSNVFNNQTVFTAGDQAPQKDVGYCSTDVFSNNAFVAGTSGILSDEINNGIFTTSSLNTLYNCATKEQLEEFLHKVKVKAGMIYPKCSMVTSYPGWKASIIDNGNNCKLHTHCTPRNHAINDLRPGPWYPCKLDKYAKPLLDISLDQTQSTGLRAYVKQLLNATFGAIASPHFLESSPLVANVITDWGRMAVWLLARNTGAVLTKTDGVLFSLNHQADLSNLGIASCVSQLPISPWLCDESYKNKKFWNRETVQEKFVGVDEVAQQIHYNGYFTNNETAIQWRCPLTMNEISNLTHIFDLHVEYVGDGFLTQGCANFKLDHIFVKGGVTKARGCDQSVPHYVLNKDSPPNEGEWVRAEIPAGVEAITKANTTAPITELTYYLKPATTGDYKMSNASLRGHFIPGDLIASKHRPRTLTPSMFHYNDAQQRMVWTKRYKHLSNSYGVGLEANYIDELGNVNFVKAKKLIQNTINKGRTPQRVPTSAIKVLLSASRPGFEELVPAKSNRKPHLQPVLAESSVLSLVQQLRTRMSGFDVEKASTAKTALLSSGVFTEAEITQLFDEAIPEGTEERIFDVQEVTKTTQPKSKALSKLEADVLDRLDQIDHNTIEAKQVWQQLFDIGLLSQDTLTLLYQEFADVGPAEANAPHTVEESPVLQAAEQQIDVSPGVEPSVLSNIDIVPMCQDACTTVVTESGASQAELPTAEEPPVPTESQSPEPTSEQAEPCTKPTAEEHLEEVLASPDVLRAYSQYRLRQNTNGSVYADFLNGPSVRLKALDNLEYLGQGVCTNVEDVISLLKLDLPQPTDANKNEVTKPTEGIQPVEDVPSSTTGPSAEGQSKPAEHPIRTALEPTPPTNPPEPQDKPPKNPYPEGFGLTDVLEEHGQFELYKIADGRVYASFPGEPGIRVRELEGFEYLRPGVYTSLDELLVLPRAAPLVPCADEPALGATPANKKQTSKAQKTKAKKTSKKKTAAGRNETAEQPAVDISVATPTNVGTTQPEEAATQLGASAAPDAFTTEESCAQRETLVPEKREGATLVEAPEPLVAEPQPVLHTRLPKEDVGQTAEPAVESESATEPVAAPAAKVEQPKKTPQVPAQAEDLFTQFDNLVPEPEPSPPVKESPPEVEASKPAAPDEGVVSTNVADAEAYALEQLVLRKAESAAPGPAPQPVIPTDSPTEGVGITAELQSPEPVISNETESLVVEPIAKQPPAEEQSTPTEESPPSSLDEIYLQQDRLKALFSDPGPIDQPTSVPADIAHTPTIIEPEVLAEPTPTEQPLETVQQALNLCSASTEPGPEEVKKQQSDEEKVDLSIPENFVRAANSFYFHYVGAKQQFYVNCDGVDTMINPTVVLPHPSDNKITPGIHDDIKYLIDHTKTNSPIFHKELCKQLHYEPGQPLPQNGFFYFEFVDPPNKDSSYVRAALFRFVSTKLVHLNRVSSEKKPTNESGSLSAKQPVQSEAPAENASPPKEKSIYDAWRTTTDPETGISKKEKQYLTMSDCGNYWERADPPVPRPVERPGPELQIEEPSKQDPLTEEPRTEPESKEKELKAVAPPQPITENMNFIATRSFLLACEAPLRFGYNPYACCFHLWIASEKFPIKIVPEYPREGNIELIKTVHNKMCTIVSYISKNKPHIYKDMLSPAVREYAQPFDEKTPHLSFVFIRPFAEETADIEKGTASLPYAVAELVGLDTSGITRPSPRQLPGVASLLPEAESETEEPTL